MAEQFKNNQQRRKDKKNWCTANYGSKRARIDGGVTSGFWKTWLDKKNTTLVLSDRFLLGLLMASTWNTQGVYPMDFESIGQPR